MFKKIFPYCFVAFIFIGCSSAENKKYSPDENTATDSAAAAVDTSVAAVDTAQAITADTPTVSIPVDTAIPIPLPVPVVTPTKPKTAVLGYSYFSHMRQDETRNIYANVVAVNQGVSVNKLKDSIIADLKEINEQIAEKRKSDTASYFTKENILFYKSLTITLLDPGNNFKIDSLGISGTQLIDTNDNNKWQWAVMPKTSAKEGRLIIKVNAQREDGSQKLIDTREISISIQLETNFWRETITWLRTNPEKLLVLILIPLFAFFGKRIFDRKKANETDKNKE